VPRRQQIRGHSPGSGRLHLTSTQQRPYYTSGATPSAPSTPGRNYAGSKGLSSPPTHCPPSLRFRNRLRLSHPERLLHHPWTGSVTVASRRPPPRTPYHHFGQRDQGAVIPSRSTTTLVPSPSFLGHPGPSPPSTVYDLVHRQSPLRPRHSDQTGTTLQPTAPHGLPWYVRRLRRHWPACFAHTPPAVRWQLHSQSSSRWRSDRCPAAWKYLDDRAPAKRHWARQPMPIRHLPFTIPAVSGLFVHSAQFTVKSHSRGFFCIPSQSRPRRNCVAFP